MQRDLANNENDWQLKKLQHDSLKTAEKVVEVLRETIEKEVLALGKDYERLFGSRSAQFAEYLTMVTQKLEQHGVQHQDVINWLHSAASEGSVPRDYASDLRDSQSKTVPFISGGPMQDFGEQSLLDKSLGNMGVSSARPVGVTGTPVANGFDPASVFDSVGAFDGAAASGAAEIGASQIAIPRPAQPVGTQNAAPTNSPAAYPPSPFGQPSFAQPAFAQPDFSAAFEQGGGQQFSQGQSGPAAPPGQAAQQTQLAQAAPSANLPITTSQPVSEPNQAFGAMPRREDKKEDDKYIFDPFTAWD